MFDSLTSHRHIGRGVGPFYFCRRVGTRGVETRVEMKRRVPRRTLSVLSNVLSDNEVKFSVLSPTLCKIRHVQTSLKIFDG